MTMTVTRKTGAILVLLTAAVAACSTLSPNLYTIAPIPAGTVVDGPKVVVLREVTLARYLDRSQIVRSSENYRLAVSANDWWGEPPGSMLSRVLVQELSERLPGSSVYAENTAMSTSPDAAIELNIQRLDEDAAGRLVLLAQGSVLFKHRREPVTRRFRLVVQPSGPDVSAEVAAISQAVAQLADGLASMVRSA
jgi:uncharacterized lipoprotein YmbA